MKKIIILSISISLLIFGCQQNGEKHQNQQNNSTEIKSSSNNTAKAGTDKYPELTAEEHFHAVVNDTMTLLEVAKVNNIGLPFLKTKLGIPSHLKYGYSIKQLKKNFRFTTVRLQTLIENTKNESAVMEKRRKQTQK